VTTTRTFMPTVSPAYQRWLNRIPSFGLLDEPIHPRDVRGDEIDRLGLADESGDDAA